MKRFKEAKVVKLYRIDDWYEFYTENGEPGTGKGFLTDHCASYFESATGIKLGIKAKNASSRSRFRK